MKQLLPFLLLTAFAQAQINSCLPVQTTTATLGANLGASDTTITLTGNSPFAMRQIVTIGSEQILVCSASGAVLTVCASDSRGNVYGRGYNGTAAATATAGATVTGIAAAPYLFDPVANPTPTAWPSSGAAFYVPSYAVTNHDIKPTPAVVDSSLIGWWPMLWSSTGWADVLATPNYLTLTGGTTSGAVVTFATSSIPSGSGVPDVIAVGPTTVVTNTIGGTGIASGTTVSAVTTSGDGATTYVTLSPAPAAGTTGFIVSQPNNNTLSQQSTWGGQMTPSQPLDCSGHALSTSWVNGPALNSGTGAGQANYFPAWASNPSGTHTYAQIASITIPSTFALVAHAQYSPISQANSNATVLEIGSRSAGLFLGTDSTHTHYQFMVNGGGSCAGGTVDGVEHSLVATYDGTNAYLYVDNSAVAGPCAFTFSGLTGVTARIGAYNNSPSSPATVAGNWYGWISGVRIYGRVLTSAERSLLYTSADR